MDRYVAMKPVRFDRDYAIGEAIAAGAVAPGMARGLVGRGMIRPVPEAAGDRGAARAQAGAAAAEESAAGLECAVCGRSMGSKSALTAHIRKAHPDYA